MARLVILHLLAAAAAAASTLDQFEEFKLRFGKVYPSAEEEATRLAIFRTNLEEYARLQAEVSYSVGVTMFSDLTEQEFKERHLGGIRRPAPSAPQARRAAPAALPAAVDWREEGVITPVKNQGQCVSCWAFATTELVESYAALATGSLLELSAQQVTSCSPNPVNCGGVGGCRGSIAQLGYSYLQLFGHTLEESWPYTLEE